MTLDASVLPSELVTTAQPLVGLSGLDVQRNATHKTIWDAFNNSKKPDSESIQYKLLPVNYEFPVSKPKRQSYEWYHPKGVLKRNWMLKHLHVLPAVVVLFQDLEWNDPQWSEKQRDCASIIQSLKNSLQGRHTRLAVVLLQKGALLPQGEDLLASERAAHLTNNCDINAKMLFVLTHNDHLMGQIFRLQSAFLELSQSCYTQIMKQIRSHKDQLTETHKNLKIRHLFKLGFISELKLDQQNALKHYRQTYANLDELRIVDTNCLEVKTIAGFVNYKICRLYFKVNAPKDAISHFKNHINKYRSRTGFKELLFEHYAWLSVQYSAFGELFCDAVKNGLAPLQTQHPGIYFHKAAEYIGKRKEAFMQCAALGPGSDGQPAASGQDHNIIEKPYIGQQRITGVKVRQGTRFEDLRLLNSINCSRDWIMQNDYLNNEVLLTFSRSRTPDHGALQGIATRQPPDDQFNRSLLAKLPTNATIIGSTNANLTNQFNLPLTSSSQSLNAATLGSSPVPPASQTTGAAMTSSTGSADDFKVKPLTTGSGYGGDQQQKDDLIKTLAQVKNIYNHTIDCVQLTNNERNGFINAALCTQSATSSVTVPAKARSVEPSGTESASGAKNNMLIFGVYCIRWCRSSSPSLINESKFVINGIEVIDPPLNIYCYLEEKMYVRVPMTLRVTLKNPTRKIVHLQALLNSSDSFMFSGHRQLNVTIFAFSSYDLLYNLYPLKAGWQLLPELQLDYVNHGNTAAAISINSGSGQQSGKRTPVPGTGSMGVSTNSSSGDTAGNTQPHLTGTEVEDMSGESMEAQLKAELDSLVKRWMPKMVFIHPPTRK